MNHFSKKTLRLLAAQGLVITGLQALPDMASAMPFANAETGYKVNHNGVGRVLTYSQVMAVAQ